MRACMMVIMIADYVRETRTKTTVTLLAIASATRMPKSTLKLWQSQLMNRYAQNGDFIPTNLKPGRFTQFAFDNLDSIG